jgi:Holliday junction resolvase RusA-like endonuclease
MSEEKNAIGLGIWMEPHAMGRPRALVTRCKSGYVAKICTPRETKEWERDAATQLKLQWGARAPIDAPVWMEIRHVASRTRKADKPRDANDRLWRVGRTDIDNEDKSVLDSLVKAGVLRDDNVVCALISTKLYVARFELPIVEIIIKNLGEPPKKVDGLRKIIGGT